MMTSGSLPKVIGVFEANSRELMKYQYLPIKLANSTEVVVEPRLQVFDKIIGAACCDFVGTYGLNRFVSSYVYLTAKRGLQTPTKSLTRAGWHIDGFGTPDINYLWSDCVPTVFNNSPFVLCDDEYISMAQMAQQADPIHNYYYPDKTLLRVDNTIVHRADTVDEPVVRTFVKVSFSADKYDLEGNSINYLLKYDWPTRPRQNRRNVPQSLG